MFFQVNRKELGLMSLLYKYYSDESQYALNNIENGLISFSPLDSLNDPFEGVGAYFYEVSDEEQKYWDSIDADLPKWVSKSIAEDCREMLNFKYRVFCTTKKYDNPLLWSYYANSHKGFCVGYEENNIKKVSDEIININYSGDMIHIDNFDETMYLQLLSVKAAEWSHEKECRAIYTLQDSDVSAFNADVYYDEKRQCDNKICILERKSQKTLCADKFIIKECKPAEIYLGMKMECKKMRHLIGIARKFNIKVYFMRQAQDSFQFLPEEVL